MYIESNTGKQYELDALDCERRAVYLLQPEVCRCSQKTTAQLASEHGLHVGQIPAWKKPVLERAGGLFDNGRVDDGVTLLRAYCRHRLEHRL